MMLTQDNCLQEDVVCLVTTSCSLTNASLPGGRILEAD